MKDFFEDIHKLKHREREGWKKHGVERPRDTIASHSFGSALIGWTMAEREGLDSDKLVKMLLMHDLIMAYVEDYVPEDEEFESKKEKELEASERLFDDVPEEIEDEFRKLFNELNEMETDEARLANESDKLDTLFQASKYSENRDENFMNEFINYYSEVFETVSGKQIFSELKDSRGENNQ